MLPPIKTVLKRSHPLTDCITLFQYEHSCTVWNLLFLPLCMLSELDATQLVHTRAGGVGFILIVPTVIVTITQPSQGDATIVLALKSLG